MKRAPHFLKVLFAKTKAKILDFNFSGQLSGSRQSHDVNWEIQSSSKPLAWSRARYGWLAIPWENLLTSSPWQRGRITDSYKGRKESDLNISRLNMRHLWPCNVLNFAWAKWMSLILPELFLPRRCFHVIRNDRSIISYRGFLLEDVFTEDVYNFSWNIKMKLLKHTKDIPRSKY